MKAAFEEVMNIRGEGLRGDGEVDITGSDPVFSTPFRIGETCASVLAGIGVALSDIWALKAGYRQNAAIDARHAAASRPHPETVGNPAPLVAADPGSRGRRAGMARPGGGGQGGRSGRVMPSDATSTVTRHR